MENKKRNVLTEININEEEKNDIDKTYNNKFNRRIKKEKDNNYIKAVISINIPGEEIEGEEQLNELIKKVEIILAKLINENFLYETKNDEDKDNPFIYINVNYDIPDIFDV